MGRGGDRLLLKIKNAKLKLTFGFNQICHLIGEIFVLLVLDWPHKFFVSQLYLQICRRRKQKIILCIFQFAVKSQFRQRQKQNVKNALYFIVLVCIFIFWQSQIACEKQRYTYICIVVHTSKLIMVGSFTESHDN